MASWLIKVLVQRGIASLPNPHFWNGLLQDRITHSVRLSDAVFEDGLRLCSDCVKELRGRSSYAQRNFSVFELGTGWYPVVPVGFFLCGAREVWTWDIIRHLKPDRLKLTIDRFLECARAQKLQDLLSINPDRLQSLGQVMRRCELETNADPANLLEPLGIHYRIGNAGQSGLPPESVDCIESNGVLEYLSPDVLSEILKEFQRIAASNAVMSHTIDLGDQYANFDSRITPFNFLRFSDGVWRLLNNPIIPLNRLRISDYRRAFEEHGFQIVQEDNRSGDPSALAGTTLAERFRKYPVEDLLVVHTKLLAVPKRAAPLAVAARAGR